jgi:hypothetical protein
MIGQLQRVLQTCCWPITGQLEDAFKSPPLPLLKVSDTSSIHVEDGLRATGVLHVRDEC